MPFSLREKEPVVAFCKPLMIDNLLRTVDLATRNPP